MLTDTDGYLIRHCSTLLGNVILLFLMQRYCSDDFKTQFCKNFCAGFLQQKSFFFSPTTNTKHQCVEAIKYLNVSGKYFQFVNSSVKAPNLYTTKTAL